MLVAVFKEVAGILLVVNKGTLSTGTSGMFVNVNNQGNSATHSITGSSYRSWSFEWTAPPPEPDWWFEVAGMTVTETVAIVEIDGQPALCKFLKIFPSIILHQRQMSY